MHVQENLLDILENNKNSTNSSPHTQIDSCSLRYLTGEACTVFAQLD